MRIASLLHPLLHPLFSPSVFTKVDPTASNSLLFDAKIHSQVELRFISIISPLVRLPASEHEYQTARSTWGDRVNLLMSCEYPSAIQRDPKFSERSVQLYPHAAAGNPGADKENAD